MKRLEPFQEEKGLAIAKLKLQTKPQSRFLTNLEVKINHGVVARSSSLDLTGGGQIFFQREGEREIRLQIIANITSESILIVDRGNYRKKK